MERWWTHFYLHFTLCIIPVPETQIYKATFLILKKKKLYHFSFIHKQFLTSQIHLRSFLISWWKLLFQPSHKIPVTPRLGHHSANKTFTRTPFPQKILQRFLLFPNSSNPSSFLKLSNLSIWSTKSKQSQRNSILPWRLGLLLSYYLMKYTPKYSKSFSIWFMYDTYLYINLSLCG